jgi:choline dehydrogenase-like flavoprotein
VQAAARVHHAAGAAEAYTLHANGGRVRTEADIARLASLPNGPNRIARFSPHVNGTARLGTNARFACCTPDGAVRGAPGVYVADGSLLPTAPGVNPQETIMAVATVLARKIHARHSSQ